MKKMTQLELPLVFKDKTKRESFAEFVQRNRRFYEQERTNLRGWNTTSATSNNSYGYNWLRWI